MLEDLIVYTPMYVTFFWSVLLLLSFPQKNKTKFLLGIFMILAFFLYFSHAIFFHGNSHNYILFGPIYTFTSLSVYPFYYWYIKTLTIDTDYKFHNLRLLIPALVFSITEFIIYQIMDQAERVNYIHDFIYHDINSTQDNILFTIQKWVFISSRIVFAMQIVFFISLGRTLILRYNNRIANFYSDLKSKSLSWVNLLLYSMMITSTMSIIFNVIGRSTFSKSIALLFIPSLIFSILLFLIGYMGYMQNHSVVDLEKDEGQPDLNLKELNQNHLKEKLLILFTKEQIYKQSDLKITQICKQLKTNRTYISTLINKEFNCTFVEFVNGYRIEEAKNLLSDLSLKNYSLNYISEIAGFGSLNTFIRTFKQKEGLTPGRYRDNHILKGET